MPFSRDSVDSDVFTQARISALLRAAPEHTWKVAARLNDFLTGEALACDLPGTVKALEDAWDAPETEMGYLAREVVSHLVGLH